jgi:hypothetical protein
MHHTQGRQHGLAHVGFWLATALCAPAEAALADSVAPGSAAVDLGYASVSTTDAADGQTAPVSRIDEKPIEENPAEARLVGTHLIDAYSVLALHAEANDTNVRDVQAVDAATPGETPFLATTPAEAAVAATASGLLWACVDDGVLDGARGGFTRSDGLMVSLGIDRLVSINGDVVARSRIDIADLGRLNADQARQTSDALSSVKLVQNGDANIYRTGDLSAALGGIVVQNSLNDQAIRTETVIRSTVNSAGLLNTLHFQSTLQDALARAVGTR